jgi:hypothetical protein
MADGERGYSASRMMLRGEMVMAGRRGRLTGFLEIRQLAIEDSLLEGGAILRVARLLAAQIQESQHRVGPCEPRFQVAFHGFFQEIIDPLLGEENR